MNVAYLCLGGNIGNRENTLEQALLKIEQQVGYIDSRSGIYETQAWGVQNQQSYLNQCLKITTHLNSSDLLNELLFIEKELGRQRLDGTTYEPRTIDIDILFFNHDVIKSPQLSVPHPRLHLRKFVLIPLVEICADYLHPLLNKTIFSLLSDCEDTSEVKPFKTAH
jgi:2-amino-4-hydroxy-6-hydroxymethyldihydropteridine diphosphokinase